MKIAFTSCLDTINDPVQPGWLRMVENAPSDRILLLGDSIYMDYGLGNHQPNGSPYGEPLDEFSRLMHAAYKAQWEVVNFQTAIKKPIVHAIWDDHDFAWNNSRGGGTAGKDYVAPAYRRLSRLHFETFRIALNQKPAAYPFNPAPTGEAAKDGGSIAQTIALTSDVALHLIDTRSFREEEGNTSQLGVQQRTQLEAALLPEPGINIIASSTTVKGWKKYRADYDWLLNIAKSRRILILSGDIHEPDFRTRGRLYEVTASAMAQPPGITAIFGKKTQVYGQLVIEPNRLEVKVFVGASLVEEHRILRSDWSVE